ncbi:MAG: hypothetical protein QF545_02555, partial [Candidatus Thalassarchaeaceae archaeon]|nr:hypothetical protein [Candidatus Thalassarchaeaceae archaeon]
NFSRRVSSTTFTHHTTGSNIVAKGDKESESSWIRTLDSLSPNRQSYLKVETTYVDYLGT